MKKGAEYFVHALLTFLSIIWERFNSNVDPHIVDNKKMWAHMHCII